MFATDQPKIQAWAWESPQNLCDTIMFARLTIRRKFYVIGAFMSAYRRDGFDGLYMAQDKKTLATASVLAEQLYKASHESPANILGAVLSVPGIGIPKAGFVAQLLTGDIGCIDSHNCTLYGIHYKELRADGRPFAVYKRVQRYITLCDQLGGSAFLWDSWCRHIARLYPSQYENAEAVSHLHVSVLTGEQHDQTTL